jgi:hypothetical protein
MRPSFASCILKFWSLPYCGKILTTQLYVRVDGWVPEPVWSSSHSTDWSIEQWSSTYATEFVLRWKQMHYQEWGVVINSAWYYSEIVHDKLKTQWFRVNAKDSCYKMSWCSTTLPVPYCCPAAHTVQILQQLSFEVLEHPAHNPDFGPLDLFVWTPQKCFKRPFCWQKWGGGGSAHVACHAAKKIFLSRHTKACVMLDQLRWKAGGLCWKIMHLWLVYCFIVDFSNNTADIFWPT